MANGNGGNQGGKPGGNAGLPAKTNDGNKSGKGRDNNPPGGGKK